MLIVAERRFTRFVRVLLDLLGGWDVLARFPTKFGSLTEKEYRHGANFTLTLSLYHAYVCTGGLSVIGSKVCHSAAIYVASCGNLLLTKFFEFHLPFCVLIRLIFKNVNYNEIGH